MFVYGCVNIALVITHSLTHSLTQGGAGHSVLLELNMKFDHAVWAKFCNVGHQISTSI